MRVLVLYEELAWYLINCLNQLADEHACEVLVICKKPNVVAPFQFRFVHPRVRIVEREGFTESELAEEVKKFDPQGILIGGWIHKPYLKLLKELKRTTVIAFDNQWTGSLKQRMGTVYFKATLKPYIQYAFVAGQPQAEFARHLGFSNNHIADGVYCCDHALFDGYYNQHKNVKESHWPKRFLYVGRYAEEKGVREMWDAFIEWQNERPNEWELWCLGKGEVQPPIHPKIKHFGFLQPEEQEEIIRNTGIFILPSTFEPWGVVVQEYAAAGFPILCTDTVGAASAFVEEGRNGFLLRSGDKKQLKEKMNIFSTLDQADLTGMSRHSAHLAAKVTPGSWAENLMKMLSNE